jgi:hypothetical protein
LTPYHGTDGKALIATRQNRNKHQENDHDQDTAIGPGVHLQVRRLPLQSLRLQELRLLAERRAAPATVRPHLPPGVTGGVDG